MDPSVVYKQVNHQYVFLSNIQLEIMDIGHQSTITVHLTIVRHAEGLHQKLGMSAGHMDFPLTPHGHEQARLAGQALQYAHFDQVLSSDSIRAYDTAVGILSENLVVNHVITPDERLRERTYGLLDGHGSRGFANCTACKEQGVLDEANSPHNPLEKPLGWEYPEEISERVTDFMTDLLNSREDGSHTLITSHGGTIKEIMDTLFLTGKIAGLPEVTSRPKNTAITQLTLNLDPSAQTNILSGKCTRYYDADHLAHF